MTDKIAEIRARHEEGIRAGADDDRAYLLAEVERLRAEVKRSRAMLQDVAEELEGEEPRSHKNIAFSIRTALEANP